MCVCVKEEEKSPAKKKMCMWKCIWIECVNYEEDNVLVVILLRLWRRRILFIFLMKDANIWRLMLPLMGLLPFFDAAAFTSDWCGCEDMVAIALYCLVLYIICSKRTSEIEIWELKDLAAGSKESNHIYRQLGILIPCHQLIVCVTVK